MCPDNKINVSLLNEHSNAATFIYMLVGIFNIPAHVCIKCTYACKLRLAKLCTCARIYVCMIMCVKNISKTHKYFD